MTHEIVLVRLISLVNGVQRPCVTTSQPSYTSSVCQYYAAPRIENDSCRRHEQNFRRIERTIANKIPAEELHRTESKCNTLLSVQEDYRHVVTDLGKNYRTKVRENHLRQIVGRVARRREIRCDLHGVKSFCDVVKDYSHRVIRLQVSGDDELHSIRCRGGIKLAFRLLKACCSFTGSGREYE